MDEMEVLRKRVKMTEGSEGEGLGGDETGMAAEAAAETSVAGTGSDEMEMNIQRILDQIERFTNQVSELLDAGRTLFKDLSNEFEERLIAIHQKHIGKWQEEIEEVRQMDTSNEAARALLQNAHHHILCSVRDDGGSAHV